MCPECGDTYIRRSDRWETLMQDNGSPEWCTGPSSGAPLHEKPVKCVPVEVVPSRGNREREEEARLALIALLVVSDSSLVPEDEFEEETALLFDRELIRLQRDYADEYVAILTDAGRDFISAVLSPTSEAPAPEEE